MNCILYSYLFIGEICLNNPTHYPIASCHVSSLVFLALIIVSIESICQIKVIALASRLKGKLWNFTYTLLKSNCIYIILYIDILAMVKSYKRVDRVMCVTMTFQVIS